MRKRRSGLGSTVALVTVFTVAATAVQQVLMMRYLNAQRRKTSANPRWVGLRYGSSDGLSPVLPQHPHAATGGNFRRAHIV
ncbi:hypothetical protein L3i23_05120 [Herbiconiux sp. L3-i23]|nr:hypothetical protein L3i23_05120 [Herbiconiux sp. L3-i23]